MRRVQDPSIASVAAKLSDVVIRPAAAAGQCRVREIIIHSTITGVRKQIFSATDAA